MPSDLEVRVLDAICRDPKSATIAHICAGWRRDSRDHLCWSMAAGFLEDTREYTMKRRFETEAAHYATVTSPEETLSFEWDEDTGAPSQFEWLHGEDSWYLHETTPGNITKESAYSYYYEVNLGITTDSQYETEYPLKGKLTVNKMRADGATFAAIHEGTGSAWLVADGTLTDVDQDPTPIA